MPSTWQPPLEALDFWDEQYDYDYFCHYFRTPCASALEVKTSFQILDNLWYAT